MTESVRELRQPFHIAIIIEDTVGFPLSSAMVVPK